MSFHFAKVVAQLGKGVVSGLQAKGSQNGLVNLRNAPAAEFGSGMKQDLHETNHAGVVDLDAGHASTAGRDGQGQALKERKIDMDVERFGFEGRKTIRRGGKFSRTASRLSRDFFSPKSLRLLLSASRRRKVVNFSYMRKTAFLPQARKT